MQQKWLPISTFILATAVVTNLLLATSSRAAAVPKVHVDYKLVELPTLGGTQDSSNWVNDLGWVTGAADLPGGRNEHAYVWREGRMLDLGTLGGTNSLAWPVNNRDEVGGDSVTSTKDPFRENFCHFNIDGVFVFQEETCRGFVWLRGVMTALPTLGGNNSSVFGMNNRGQVVGVAEAGSVDPHCVSPQVLDYKPVIWQPGGGLQELQLFPGDTAGGAIAINDIGQVVGGSGNCAPLTPAASAHALLWRNGSVTYLGGFGGKMNNVPFDINNRGQIVGLSDLPGDTTSHAFLWQNGVMTDLGTLPGDFSSGAFGINDKGQVVGQSCDINFNCRAFIWQDGVMSDLNSLISHRSALFLTTGSHINERGEIAGQAFEKTSGGIPAFLAIPTNEHSAHPSTGFMLPASVRERFRQRRGLGRFGQ